MENSKMLDILNKLYTLLQYDSKDIARNLVRVEIENLKGITERRCHNTIYNNQGWYCKDCHNLNCNYNKKDI